MRVLSATVLAILVPSFLSAGGISESGEGETARGTVPAFRIQAHPEAPTAPGVGGAGLDLLRRRRDDLPRPVWTGQEPLSVVAVFDLSSSVSGARLHAAIAGVQALFSALDDEDRCALLGFTRSVELHAGWDGTCADAAVAAAALRSGGPAAFNNALTLAFGLLADRPGRPVLVIFTDGVDGASWARDSW
ncbi:MAG: VWA domain-containing protein, partial [Acidobacteria bacterium]|nr:VWA domain-containing protein [Acidobacteriota bacterium]